MYYDINYRNSNKNGLWKFHLDPNVVEPNFWIKSANINTYGDHRFVLKNITIPTVTVVCLIHCVAIILFYNNAIMICWDTIHDAIFGLPVIVLISLYFLCPNDAKSTLRRELSVITLIGILGVTVSLTAHFLLSNNKNLSIPTENEEIEIQALITLFTVNCTTYCMLSTWWVGRKYTEDDIDHIRVIQTKHNENHKHINNDSYNYSDRGNRQVKVQQIGSILSINEIFGNEDYLLQFIDYLCGESEIHQLLCFIEMVQFKVFIDETFNIDYKQTCNKQLETIHEDSEETQYINDIQFNYSWFKDLITSNPNIPKSDIIYNVHGTYNNPIEHILKIIYPIYCKYIKGEQCAHSLVIDIPETLRKCYDADIDMDIDEYISRQRENKITDFDLFEYFDPIIKHLFVSIKTLNRGFHPSV